MNGAGASDDPIATEAAFVEALQALLVEAYENGIDVEGGWECRNGADNPDWEAVIVEMTKSDEE